MVVCPLERYLLRRGQARDEKSVFRLASGNNIFDVHSVIVYWLTGLRRMVRTSERVERSFAKAGMEMDNRDANSLLKLKRNTM